VDETDGDKDHLGAATLGCRLGAGLPGVAAVVPECLRASLLQGDRKFRSAAVEESDCAGFRPAKDWRSVNGPAVCQLLPETTLDTTVEPGGSMAKPGYGW